MTLEKLAEKTRELEAKVKSGATPQEATTVTQPFLGARESGHLHPMTIAAGARGFVYFDGLMVLTARARERLL